MIEHKEKISIDCDLSFVSFSFMIKEFNNKYKFLPNCIRISVNLLDVAKSILKHIEPKDYQEIKDKIDLGFSFEMNTDFPDYYWQLEGIKDDEKYIIYSLGA